jgi:predicted enzyme related to lactoylglutathione lyase
MRGNQKACSIEWVVIPAPNLDLAKSFYAKVFRFEVSDYSETFAVFKAGNISGGLDSQLIPSHASTSFSITVKNIPEALKAIAKNGGKILKQKYSLGKKLGYCARFEDPNGNAYELYGAT